MGYLEASLLLGVTFTLLLMVVGIQVWSIFGKYLDGDIGLFRFLSLCFWTIFILGVLARCLFQFGVSFLFAKNILILVPFDSSAFFKFVLAFPFLLFSPIILLGLSCLSLKSLSQLVDRRKYELSKGGENAPI